jgi:hypothetical protein
MTTGDVFIQRLAAALVQIEYEVLEDEADRRLFRDWLALYRAQQKRQDTRQ